MASRFLPLAETAAFSFAGLDFHDPAESDI
jgi:hypothetical protein